LLLFSFSAFNKFNIEFKEVAVVVVGGGGGGAG
jgi:hypothetical protein